MGIPISGSSNVLARALSARRHSQGNPDHEIVGSGDLQQLGAQEEALQAGGFEVGRRDVYPTVPKGDVLRALTFLYKRRVKGWWNMEHSLVPVVCSQAVFDKALGRITK
jgi:hypothetical protein